MLIVFDDEKQFREIYKEMFPKLSINLKTMECSTKDEIRKVLKDPEIMGRAKVLVFDLSTSKEEAETLNFDILKDIASNYRKYPIPIFIHSAFAHKVEGYENLGTLFKIKKSADSAEGILSKIKLFHDSGFLDIFSPGGFLENELHHELHNAFIDQFQGEEVAQILKSIEHSSPENFKDRTKSVFLRIAVRTLFQNLMSEKKHMETGKVEEIKINAVEHYYRRKGDFPVWTGDIFQNKNERIVILTPRCDINNGYCNGNYLACIVDVLDEKRVKAFGKEPDNLKQYLEDNPQNTGLKYRYLVPTPAFSGGKVDLTSYFIINQSKLNGEAAEYKYLISLSDELTNDVVRKYASYILRGGVSASELNEASYFSASIANEAKPK